jgi:hypothetical protein
MPGTQVPPLPTANPISQWNKGLIAAFTHSNQDYAARCVRLAQRTENPADKAMLLQMAETWRRLAERIEQGSSNNSGPH